MQRTDMQEKRNKRLALLLAVLTAVIVAIPFLRERSHDFSPDSHTYNDFDLKAVDRVLIESAKGKTDLRYQGYRWKVNDSLYADRGLIEVLFATIKQAEAKRPVATSLRDSVIRELKEHGSRVSVFSGNRVLSTFYAGGNPQKTQAVFLQENSGDPHLMTIPGYRVYVSGIFELPALAWKEKRIFNFNWQNFSKLEARYKNPIGDFDVILEKNQVSIPQIAEADTSKLNTYVDAVSLLTAEEYILPNKLTDSLAATPSVVQLTVRDFAQREYRLSVFTVGRQFYAKTPDNSWAILSENQIIPILRSKDFFVKR